MSTGIIAFVSSLSKTSEPDESSYYFLIRQKHGKIINNSKSFINILVFSFKCFCSPQACIRGSGKKGKHGRGEREKP